MALISAKKKHIAQRRAEVAKLFSAGLNQFEMGEKLGVDRSTISLDLKALEATWLVLAVTELAKWKAQEIIRINEIEREAWESWEKSKSDKETKQKKQSDLPIGSAKKTEVSVKTESNFGDTKYLQVVQWCIDRRIKLLGLDAPQKIETSIKSAGGEKLRQAIDKMDEDQKEQFFNAIDVVELEDDAK